MKSRKIVLVDWEDAYNNPEWLDDESLGLMPACMNQAVGFLKKAQPGYVVVVPLVGGNTGRYAGTMKIPKSLVYSIKVLEVKSAGKP